MPHSFACAFGARPARTARRGFFAAPLFETVIPSKLFEAMMAGDLYVPVDLATLSGSLTADDLGKSARLRLSKRLFGGEGFGFIREGMK